MPRKDLESRKQYQKEYAQRNQEKARLRLKEWKASNPEKVAEQNKRYAKKHPETLVAKAIRWKNANPERAAEISRNTRLKNKDRIIANKAKYRAGKSNRTPAWLTEIDFERIRNEYKLAVLLTKVTGEPWEVDHVIPLHGKNVSGFHVPSNLQVLRASENRLKNSKYEVEYA